MEEGRKDIYSLILLLHSSVEGGGEGEVVWGVWTWCICMDAMGGYEEVEVEEEVEEEEEVGEEGGGGGG